MDRKDYNLKTEPKIMYNDKPDNLHYIRPNQDRLETSASYAEKKGLLMAKMKTLMKKYDELSRETMHIGSEMGKLLSGRNITANDEIDFASLIGKNEEVAKFTRLMVACQYIDCPKSEVAIRYLQENISVNNMSEEEAEKKFKGR